MLLGISRCVNHKPQIKTQANHEKTYQNSLHAEIYGSAIYSDNSPAANLTILLKKETLTDWNRKTQTDQDGKFVIEGITPGRQFHLELLLPSGISMYYFIRELDKGKRYGPIQLDIDPLIRISGNVYKETSGLPVAGAQIVIRPKNNTMAGQAVVTTDESGFYLFKDVPRCIAQVIVYAEDCFIHKQEQVFTCDRSWGQFDFHLEKPASIQGTLKYKNGSPLSDIRIDAQVWNSLEQKEITRRTITDNNGLFRFEDIVFMHWNPFTFFHDQVILPAEPESFWYQSHGFTTNHSESLEETFFVKDDFRLENAMLTLSGRVMDHDGNLIEGVELHIRSGEYDYTQEFGQITDTTTSGSKGEYFLQKIQVLESYTYETWIVAKKEGLARFARQLEPDLFESISGNLDIVMEPGLSISGHLIDSNGYPVVNAEVTAWNERIFSLDTSKTKTDSKGFFEFNELKHDIYYIQAKIAGRHGEYATAKNVTPGTENLVLHMNKSGIVMIRVIEESTGFPVTKYCANYEITDPVVSHGLDSGYAEVFDFDGKYTFPNVDFGDIKIYVELFQYFPKIEKFATLNSVNSPLEMTFSVPGHKLKGYIFGKDESDPIHGALIEVLYPEPPNVDCLLKTGNSDLEGYFVIPYIPEGVWKLAVRLCEEDFLVSTDVNVTGNQPPIKIFMKR